MCWRWIPHPKMPADAMLKSQVSKGSLALQHLLKSGTFALADENAEMTKRETDETRKSRSREASRRRLAEDEDSGSLLSSPLRSSAEQPQQRHRKPRRRLRAPVGQLTLLTMPPARGTSESVTSRSSSV